MNKLMFLVFSFFVLVTPVSAQSVQTSEERVRTSTIIPDLYDVNSGWKNEFGRDGNFAFVTYQGKSLTVKGSEEYYTNAKDKMVAILWFRKDNNGNREEVFMLYGTDNVVRGAIKSGGKWYVSKELYFDNGKTNPNGSFSSEIVYDDKEADKPIKVKFVLITIVGPKEVVFDLQ